MEDMEEVFYSGPQPLNDISGQSIVSCSGTAGMPASPSVPEYFGNLFTTSLWPARWTCGEWSPTEGWLYIISDLSIFLAYFSIPIMLFVFTRKKRSGKLRAVVILFASFITLCGFTHLIDAILFWEPVYRLSGFVRALTGIVSLSTAVVLGFVMPKALQFKSPVELENEISIRKQVQNQLELFVKFCPAAVAMVDTNMRYIMASDSWLEDYGLEGKTLIGKSHYEIFPEIRDKPDWMESHQRALGGEEVNKEFDSFETESGTVYLRWKLHPWHQSNGEVGGIIMFTEIITDEILIEQRVREQEELIRVRTQELQEAVDNLESFTYSVSHDLRAPLRAIQGFSEALMADFKDSLNEEAVRYLKRISVNSSKMGKLIDELLAFSRLDRRKKEYRVTDLNEVAKNVISEFFPEQSGKILLKRLPVLNCDREMINQVFVNLISNAVKYSSKQVNPHIQIESSELEDAYVIKFEDNGVGFNMDYSDKLFKVFQRLHNESEFEGTGVGLAICHKIIKSHGGEIWAESVEGGGAKFFVKLLKTNESIE